MNLDYQTQGRDKLINRGAAPSIRKMVCYVALILWPFATYFIAAPIETDHVRQELIGTDFYVAKLRIKDMRASLDEQPITNRSTHLAQQDDMNAYVIQRIAVALDQMQVHNAYDPLLTSSLPIWPSLHQRQLAITEYKSYVVDTTQEYSRVLSYATALRKQFGEAPSLMLYDDDNARTFQRVRSPTEEQQHMTLGAPRHPDGTPNPGPYDIFHLDAYAAKIPALCATKNKQIDEYLGLMKAMPQPQDLKPLTAALTASVATLHQNLERISKAAQSRNFIELDAAFKEYASTDTEFIRLASIDLSDYLNEHSVLQQEIDRVLQAPQP